jgi:hypothetical protein
MAKAGIGTGGAKVLGSRDQEIGRLLARKLWVGLPNQCRSPGDVRARGRSAVKLPLPVAGSRNPGGGRYLGFEPPVRRRALRAVLGQTIVFPIGCSDSERIARVTGNAKTALRDRPAHVSLDNENVKCHRCVDVFGLDDHIDHLAFRISGQHLKGLLPNLTRLLL